jgi:hypothetical protein
MNDRDRDIIVDLIEGRLSETDTSAALSRVTNDPEFAAEYHAQLAVHGSLTSLEPVAMTASERESLRSALTEQLHLAGSAAPAVEPKRSGRKMWWAPLAGFAAAAAAVTAFVALPSSSDDAGSDVAFVESESPTASLSEAADGAAVEGEDSQLFAPGEPMLVVDLSDATPEELLSVAKNRSLPEDIQNSLAVAGYDGDLLIDQSALQRCIDLIKSELPPEVHLLGASTTNGTTTVYLGLTSASESVDAIVSIDLGDCSFTTATSGLDVTED